jgi:hypothetical protein
LLSIGTVSLISRSERLLMQFKTVTRNVKQVQVQSQYRAPQFHQVSVGIRLNYQELAPPCTTSDCQSRLPYVEGTSPHAPHPPALTAELLDQITGQIDRVRAD